MIEQVVIRNFRSITSASIQTRNITVLVGPNDSGKSNVLRALNLFFNGEIEPGRRLDFDADYSGVARKVQGKAKEISVELTISPPSTYKERRSVVWKKVWRRGAAAPYFSSRVFEDGAEISGRTKVGAWLDRLRFEYVPAIKSSDYFIRLLRELHDTFAETIDSDLRNASASFVTSIHKHTKSMSNGLQTALGFSSEVELPNNLGSLFEVLEFNTREESSSIPLSSRGDGVKVRHIPVILKFIADQRNINASSGHIKSDTIWGYEEPENNLELSKAYELRDAFLVYGFDTQIVLTTHSPAFYGLCEASADIDTKRYYVTRTSSDGTRIEENVVRDGVADLDRELGLLPLVEPHIRAAVEEAKALRESLIESQQYLPHPSETSIFVEGVTDKAVIEVILAQDVSAQQIKAVDAGGANWVADCLLATVALGANVGHSIGVLDGDVAGEDASRRIDELSTQLRKMPSNISKIRLAKLKPTPEVLELRKSGLRVPVALEELAGASAWRHAEAKGWLESRQGILEYNDWKNPDIAFFDHCSGLGLSSDALRVLKFRVEPGSKSKFANYLRTQLIEGKIEEHAGLNQLRLAFLDVLARIAREP